MKPSTVPFQAHHYTYGEIQQHLRALEADRHRLYDLLERIVHAHRDGEPDTAALLATMALTDRPEVRDA